MILHLVTDRRRLASAGDEAFRRSCLLAQVGHAVDAGVDVIQIREPDLEAGPLARLVADVVALTRSSSTRVVVNERVDVAVASGADGVHLRGDSFAAVAVRRCVPDGFLIGRSVHSLDDVRSAGPVDYLIAGTVWRTESKPEQRTYLGTDGLSQLARASAVPVLGIGGVDVERMTDLAATGAAGAAAIGAFLGNRGPCRAIPLTQVVEACRTAFDAARMNPRRSGLS